jgi:hypothetical protein
LVQHRLKRCRYRMSECSRTGFLILTSLVKCGSGVGSRAGSVSVIFLNRFEDPDPCLNLTDPECRVGILMPVLSLNISTCSSF